MFTGLVEAVGEIVAREPLPGGFRLHVRSPLAAELREGDSLAVNGVCLTTIAANGREMQADVGPETERVTALGRLAVGSLVNLERPLRADSRFGGHFVQGHVDAVGTVADLRPDAEFHWLAVEFPPALAPYMVLKGSIAVDGISLTIARLAADRFEVQIVPYTMAHTTLSRASVHDAVNLECDMIGKYVARAMEIRDSELGIRN